MHEIKIQELEPERDTAYDLILQKYERYGLKLEPIDSARLRRILKECRNDKKIIINLDENGFEIISEAESRFFQEAFGIDIKSYVAGVSGQEYKKRMRELLEHVRIKIRKDLTML